MYKCWGWIFIRSKNKHSENNSDNRNILRDKKKAEKYSFLAVEKVSEKNQTFATRSDKHEHEY